MVFHFQRPKFIVYGTMFKGGGEFKNPSFNICQASTRVAGTSDSFILLYYFWGKKMQHIEILFPNQTTEFWKIPNFLPLYWFKNDIMTR